MSAVITEFPLDKIDQCIPPLPGRRVFYLGGHSYSVGPGYSWTTEYWVKRVERGKKWEIYSTYPEETGRQRLFFGLYTPEDVKEYFDSVGFEIRDQDWWDMGWRPSEGAEVFKFEICYWEARQEKIHETL